MTLPTAMIVGPQKAGTSWIYAYLQWRDDVNVAKGVKETFFFDKYYHKGIEWYAKHFRTTPDLKCILEVGPTYFENLKAPDRILDNLGDIPIICTLRDPAKRTFSLYLHRVRYGQIKGGFREAVKNKEVIDGSFYHELLLSWKNLFSSVNILLLEDLVRDREAYVRELCEFLGIPYVPVPEHLTGKSFEAAVAPNYYVAATADRVGNVLRSLRLYPIIEFAKKAGLKEMIFGKPDAKAKAKVPTLSSEDRSWLIENHFKEDIQGLEKMLGRDLSDWLK